MALRMLVASVLAVQLSASALAAEYDATWESLD